MPSQRSIYPLIKLPRVVHMRRLRRLHNCGWVSVSCHIIRFWDMLEEYISLLCGHTVWTTVLTLNCQ